MFAEVCDLFLARDTAPVDSARLSHWLVLASRLTDIAEGRPLRHGMRVAMVAYHLAKLSDLSLEDTQVTVQF
jgi:hypothetical protein